jgi:hypothetical protein
MNRWSYVPHGSTFLFWAVYESSTIWGSSRCAAISRKWDVLGPINNAKISGIWTFKWTKIMHSMDHTIFRSSFITKVCMRNAEKNCTAPLQFKHNYSDIASSTYGFLLRGLAFKIYTSYSVRTAVHRGLWNFHRRPKIEMCSHVVHKIIYSSSWTASSEFENI